MKRFYITNGFNLNANSITGLKLIGYNSDELGSNLSEKNELGTIREIGFTNLYKVYTALLTQSGTNPPSVKVLENQLGGDIIWTYSDVGRYVGTLTNGFNSNTTILIGSSFALNTGYTWGYATNNNDNIYLNIENDGGYADDELLKTAIELRVYI